MGYIISQLAKCQELVAFLRTLIDEDLRNLIDAVEERSEQHVNESTVSDLIDTKRYMEPLLRVKAPNQARNILNAIVQNRILTNSMKTKVDILIDSCVNNFHSLKELYSNVANRGEMTKEIIYNALQYGLYTFISPRCHVTLSYDRGDSVAKKGLQELNDCRSRALLMVSSRSKSVECSTDNTIRSAISKPDLQTFIECVEAINEIKQLCSKLFDSGHFDFTQFEHEGNKLHHLRKIRNNLQSMYDDWKNTLEKAREKFYYLNFFHARQLLLLDRFFNGDRKLSKKEFMDLEDAFSFVHVDVHVDGDLWDRCKPQTRSTGLESRLFHVGKTLHQLFSTKKPEPKYIPFGEHRLSQNTLDTRVQRGKVFVAELEEKSKMAIPILLKLYRNTTGTLPESNQVVFCHAGTSWEEIFLLLLRCGGASDKLYMLVNVELLPTDTQIKLVEEVKRMQERQSKGFLLTLICCGGKFHHIIDQFSPNYTHKIDGLSQTEMQNYFCSEVQNMMHIEVVTSTLPGLGKTEYIKKLASQLGLGVSTFQVSGPITKADLVEQLKQLNSAQCKILHIDAGPMTNTYLFDTFVFELVVIGMVVSGTTLFRVRKSKIVLEIANTQEDKLRNALTVCSLFKQTRLIWEDFKTFVVSEEINSPVQVVCRYLKHLKPLNIDLGLDDVDIVLTGDNRHEQLIALTATECRNLLKAYYGSENGLSFSVIQTFLAILAQELRRMSASLYFKTKNLNQMLGKNYKGVRGQIVQALCDVAKEFSARSTKAVSSAPLSSQDAVASLVEHHTPTTTSASQIVARAQGMVKWADSNHLLVVFHRQDSQTISILYRLLDKVPEQIKKLFETQMQKTLPDYTDKTHDDLQKILEMICRSTKQRFEIKEKMGKDLAGHYAFTPDNLLKMVLIFIRIKSHIPVIIMGETGCGKTTLVTYLASVCKIPFFTLCVHAGVTEARILGFVDELTCEAEKNTEKDVWAFLDEINTSDHLGLLNDIMCHHRCKGRQLPYNLAFIAACNPYRLREDTIVSEGLPKSAVGDVQSNLVYRVHPLPETMMDYVWDFGSLNESDEKTYIKRMLNDLKNESFEELVLMSQRFLREKQKTSYCVSLRDVHRCKHLSWWFKEMLEKKGLVNISTPNFPKKLNCPTYRSILLALCHCYQSRMIKDDARKQYRTHIADILSKHTGITKVNEDHVEQVMEIEQEDILDRMQLPPGTAKNKALKENVFIILTSILNRIPVFVVGKPGCSKSLSMQLIRSNLRGPDSSDPYFKKLESLYVVSYQGSASSTSEGIVKVFEKAENYKKHNPNVLPVVLLDEIGLAEISHSNPLKVLHSKLEPTVGGFPKVAVVGISNWALDAAKMNRAIHLARPEPTIDDLVYTANCIRDENIKNDGKDVINSVITETNLKSLAEAYYEYQQGQKCKYQKDQNRKLLCDFYGLRDYYCLVKFVTMEAVKIDKEPGEIIQKGLLRNFGGQEMETQNILHSFATKIGIIPKSHQRPDVVELIQDNINDRHSRHLMLITNGDSALNILEQSLQNKDQVTIYGSWFENDLASEEYNYRILSEIILCMERGVVLILKDLNNIYSSLYDMLNQNYTIVGKKRNCRVALGAYSNPICQVHDDFRCIVLIDQRHVDLSDPPFLNRFEKQILSFQHVLDKSQLDAIDLLNKWVGDISTIEGLQFNPQDMFLGFHTDTLPSLVFRYRRQCENECTNAEDIATWCKTYLLNVACPDAVLRASRTILSTVQPLAVKELQEMYFALPLNKGLAYFWDNHAQEKRLNSDGKNETCEKFIVYTHSNIYTDISKCIQGRVKIQAEKLSNLKSERHLTTWIHNFYFESDADLLVLQCMTSFDAENILLSKCRLDQAFNEYLKLDSQRKNKHVCMVIHIERGKQSAQDELECQWQFNFLCGWEQYTLDSLETTTPNLETIRGRKVFDLFTTDIVDLKTIIDEQLLWCFSCLNYLNQPRSVERALQMARNIMESPTFIACLREQILLYIHTHDDEGQTHLLATKCIGWQTKVACNSELLSRCSTLVDAMLEHVKVCVRVPLTKIIFFLENECAWAGTPIYETSEESVVDDTFAFWKSCFENNTTFDILSKTLPEPRGVESCNIDSRLLDFKFPFFKIFYETIESKRIWLMQSESPELDDNIHILSTQLAQMIRKIPTLFTHDYLENNRDHYFDDVCNMFSVEHAPRMSESSRLKITKLLLGHIKPLTSGDKGNKGIAEWIAELHIILCFNTKQLSSELQLISIWAEISQDDVFTVMESASEQSIAGGSSTDRSITMENRETAERVSDNSMVKEYEVLSVENVLLSLSNQSIDEKTKTECYENDIEPYDTHSGHEPHVDIDVNSFDVNLVSQICKLIMPVRKTIEQLGDIRIWQQKVNLVLLLAGRVTKDSETLHFLRMCRDFASLATFNFNIPVEKLSNIADMGILLSKPLQDKPIFTYILCEVNDLIRAEDDLRRRQKLQEFLCMYFNLCLEVNLDTPLLPQILDSLFNKSDELICGSRSVLLNIIQNELEDNKDAFSKEIIIDGNLNEDDFPNLKLIDDLLTKRDAGSHLAVACCDIIHDVVFEELDSRIIRSKCSKNSNQYQQLIDLATTAVDVYYQSKSSLRFVVAGAYVRAFSEAVADFLHIVDAKEFTSEGEYFNFAKAINTLFARDESSTIRMSLLKSLRTFMSLTELREQCLLYPIPLLDIEWNIKLHQHKLCFNPLNYVEHYSDAIVAVVKFQKDDTQKEDIKSFIGKAKESDGHRIALLAAVTETFYWTRTTSELTASDKTAAEWLVQETNGFGDAFERFLKCLVGVADFQGILNISKMTPQMHLQYIAVVIHLASVVVAQIDTAGEIPYFRMCLSSSLALNEVYVPGMGKPESVLQHHIKSGLALTVCTCGLSMAGEQYLTKTCPMCKRQLVNKDITDDDFINQNFQPPEYNMKGYARYESDNDCAVSQSVRKMSPLAFWTLDVLTHACLLAGLSCTLVSEEDMRSVVDNNLKQGDDFEIKINEVENSLIQTGDKMRQDTLAQSRLYSYFNEILEKDWKLLKEIARNEDATFFCHRIIKRISKGSHVESVDGSMSLFRATPRTIEERDQFECYFTDAVRLEEHELITNLKMFKRACLEEQCGSSNCLESQLEELNGEAPENLDNSKSRIFRNKRTPTFHDFRASFLSSESQENREYPFLRLFFLRVATLNYIKYLPDLLKWDKLMTSRLSQRITQHEAKRIPIQDFLSTGNRRFHSDEESCKADAAQFKVFQNAWDAVRDGWKILTGTSPNFETMTEVKPISLCLIDTKDQNCPMQKMISVLQEKQNSFLKEALATAIEGSTSLSFLIKGSGIAGLYNAPLNKATTSEMISFNWSDKLLIYHDIGTEYGEGCVITYNFTKIERDLAQKLVLNKVILTGATTFSNFIFSDELFHACSKALAEIKNTIKQEPLPPNVHKLIWKAQEQRMSFAQDLLEYLEIIIGLLKKTDGEPENCVEEYIQRWSTQLPRSFPEDLLPEPKHYFKLKHIVNLYEILEDILQDTVVRSLHDNYRTNLSKVHEEYLSSKLKLLVISEMETALATIRRFVFRYLRKDISIDLTMSLVLLMKRSFGTEFDCELLDKVIPEGLNVCQVVKLVDFIQKQVKERIESRSSSSRMPKQQNRVRGRPRQRKGGLGSAVS